MMTAPGVTALAAPSWPRRDVALYSTCPPYQGESPARYYRRLREVARWSEDGGCDGILVYTDNSLLDPWLIAQLIVQSTARLCPLVAVQPIYMHPYTAAKMVATLALLYSRRIDLNLVAGGFKNDLIALDDRTAHDHRYARLIEYGTIMRRLLAGDSVTFKGEFYNVTNLSLIPLLPPQLMPRLFLSGSSSAGLEAARALDATPVRYPAPADTSRVEGDKGVMEFGIRVGIIGRSDECYAWRVARQRFPEDRRGQVLHQLAMKMSDSTWHRQLSDLASHLPADGVYWMVPFQNYKTFCPYLVGSYDQVGEELSRYFTAGCSTVILDVPRETEDLHHLRRTLSAAAKVGQPR